MLLVERFPQFDADLDAIADYIAARNLSAAVCFVDAVEDTARRLLEFPKLGTLCDFSNPTTAGLRVITVRRFTNYLIYFRPLDDRIQLVRLIHGMRDQMRKFEGG
jgi:toxin ParE1/3/4